MPEHDEDDAPEEKGSDLTDEEILELHAEEARKRDISFSTTPNLRIPKADRWKVQDKVVDEAETK